MINWGETIYSLIKCLLCAKKITFIHQQAVQIEWVHVYKYPCTYYSFNKWWLFLLLYSYSWERERKRGKWPGGLIFGVRPDGVPKTQADSNVRKAVVQIDRDNLGPLARPWRKKTLPGGLYVDISGWINMRWTQEGMWFSQQADSETPREAPGSCSLVSISRTAGPDPVTEKEADGGREKV